MTSSGAGPERARALDPLFALGRASRPTFDFTDEGQVERYAAAEIARAEALRLALAARTAFARPGARDELLRRWRTDFELTLMRYNQYLLLGDEKRAELEDIYDAFAADVGRWLADAGRTSANLESLWRELVEAVADHHVALWQFVRSLVGEQLVGEKAGSAPSAGPLAPACHEYDPRFQLALWDVTADNVRERLQEPILDLGCGQKAALVRHLRDAGLEAFGIDKFAEEGPWVRRGDWLDTPLEPGRWGTIISHMAFSNHFFHHHLRKDGHPERYARRYMEILGALKPGGRFLYAPGLPFFEELLPEEKARVRTFAIPVSAEFAELLHAMEARAAGGGAADRRPALYATEVQVGGAA